MEIEHLRTAVGELAATVRRHEDGLRVCAHGSDAVASLPALPNLEVSFQ